VKVVRKRIYVSNDGPQNGDPHIVAFSKRLHTAMLAKGMRQSDLAREAERHMPKGIKFGRHLISSYIRGHHMPNPLNLEAIAKALGVKGTDLLPEGAATVVGVTDRAIQVTMSAGGMARLKLDMELPSDVALKIMVLANSGRTD
jgi:transcriptional regulator with XRE-family HTH domain